MLKEFLKAQAIESLQASFRIRPQSTASIDLWVDGNDGELPHPLNCEGLDGGMPCPMVGQAGRIAPDVLIQKKDPQRFGVISEAL